MKKNAVVEISEEATKSAKEYIGNKFNLFVQQREDGIDEAYAIADWMYHCGAARARYDSERREFVPETVESGANVGSPMFYGQVNAMAGGLTGILTSGHRLINYSDKSLPGNPSGTNALPADGMNLLAEKYAEIDGFEWKMPEFAVSVFRDSNIFACVSMDSKEIPLVRSEEEVENTGYTTEAGDDIVNLKKRIKKIKGKTFSYPSVWFPPPQNVYLDKLIPRVADQECVVLLSQTNKQQLRREGKLLDQEAITAIDMDTMRWDGTFGGLAGENTSENTLRDDDTKAGDVILRWDIYAWVPVGKDGEWDDESTEYSLYWFVMVGNTISDAVLLKAVTDFDPDGEIPIKEIKASPDKSGLMYHTFLSEVVRPLYAADVAMINQALDRDALVNNPPVEILEGAHRIKDFSFKPGAKWRVLKPGAIRPFPISATQMQTVALRENIRDDMKLALATDSTRLGEYAKSHTSATEVLKLTGATTSTIQMRAQYILGQFLPWLGKKYISYTEAFVDPECIRLVIDEHLPHPIEHPKVSAGLYDISVEIVGKFADDIAREQAIDRAMQIIGANPAFLNSPTHSVDIGKLVEGYFASKKLGSSIVGAPQSGDSEEAVRSRIDRMMATGEVVPLTGQENISAHIRIVRAAISNYMRLPNDDPRKFRVEVLKQYLESLRGALQGAGGPAGLPGRSNPGGTPAGVLPETTPGQDFGNVGAAEIGSVMGGV